MVRAGRWGPLNGLHGSSQKLPDILCAALCVCTCATALTKFSKTSVSPRKKLRPSVERAGGINERILVMLVLMVLVLLRKGKVTVGL